MKKDSKNTLKLDKNNKLSDFFVDNNTDIGKSYKEIYLKFIKKQNEELNPLLKIKIDNEIFEKNCTKKVNIQNINEKEIFTLKLPENFPFIDIIFDNSYRKTIIDHDYKSYNQFDIDLDNIEDTMTELLLKNKKLLNDIIINFIYKNEDLNFKNNDVITIFNNNPSIKLEKIDLNDKVKLYEFYDSNHENINLLLTIINDFTQLIIFLNNNKNNDKISDKISGTKEISETFKILNEIEISEDFKKIFEEGEEDKKKNLTINKTTNLFIYYLRLIFDKKIKDEFNKYQIELEDKKKNKIEKYFKNENLLIGKEIFRNAIRLLITLYLYKENDKEEKIKKNTNNVVNYLNIKDIWIDISTNKKEFKEELKDIKKLKIQINQILYIYELLTDDKTKEEDNKYYDEVIKEIENRTEKSETEEKESDEEESEKEESEKSEDEKSEISEQEEIEEDENRD